MNTLIDRRFREHPLRYIGQASLAMVSTLIVLFVSDAVQRTVSIATLGASTFIAFTMPHKRLSEPRLLIGGYLIGTLTGSLSYFVAVGTGLTEKGVVVAGVMPFFGALAVGLAIFLMVILDTEHPPAAGLALGYVVNGVSLGKIITLIVAIVLVSVIKTLLKPMMIDLM
jgi:CBS-domain-containing membrane protein